MSLFNLFKVHEIILSAFCIITCIVYILRAIKQRKTNFHYCLHQWSFKFLNLESRMWPQYRTFTIYLLLLLLLLLKLNQNNNKQHSHCCDRTAGWNMQQISQMLLKLYATYTVYIQSIIKGKVQVFCSLSIIISIVPSIYDVLVYQH